MHELIRQTYVLPSPHGAIPHNLPTNPTPSKRPLGSSWASVMPFPLPFDTFDDEATRVMISGSGSGEPLGILNTPGIPAALAISKEHLEAHQVDTLRKGSMSIIAHPALEEWLPDWAYFSEYAIDARQEQARVILVSLNTCHSAIGQLDDDGNIPFLFHAHGSDAIVLGGPNLNLENLR